MKTKIKRKAKACSMGDAIGGGIDLLTNIGGKSTATTQSEVVSKSIADVGKGAAAGAKIGSMFGPIGGAIGAVGGAAIGAIGKKGGIEQTKGFTEDNAYTLNTGIMAIGNKKLKKKQALDKSNVQGNQIAVANTTELQSKWDEENVQNANTFAEGGELNSEMAYVDDGELIKTPDGQVNKVPEYGRPTDSNLMNLPGGSRILSDKLKIPGTKKTFAQIGEQMMTKRQSKGVDRFAENSKKLNNMNNATIHDQLFDMQEQLKQEMNIQPKTKAYADGGKVKPLGFLTRTWGETTQNIQPTMSGIDTSSSITAPTTLNKIDTKKAAVPYVDVQGEKTKAKWGRMGNVAGNVATDLASLSPALSNMFQGNAESVKDVQNPYANTIARTMRRRSYDINPAKQALTQSRAISDYNAGQSNTNTGSNIAYRLQSAIGLDKATSGLYSEASNVQNQYDADYANTMNNLGQQNVSATNMAVEINARNRAATRNIRKAGMSQLSEYAQNKQLMNNQKSRDMATLDLYKPFLAAGFTKEQLDNLISQYTR